MSRRAYLLAASVSLLLCWAQFLLTSRWADIDGALNGAKRPYYIAALLVTTLALLTSRSSTGARLGRLLPLTVLASGVVLLAAGWFIWFPLSSWNGIPYLDNWTTRYQATMDGIALLKQGAATGWNWDFLGGYHTASDITQSLTVLAFVPVTIFGGPLGWHLLHAAFFASLPALVYLDLRLEGDRRVAALAAGLTCFTTAGFSYWLFRSGDTNSLAGLTTTLLALVAAHAAARGRRWGMPVLMLAMAAVAWSHAGFLIYAALFLLVDAAVARDNRRALRAVIATVLAIIATLPFTWELWRYPSYFIANNVILDPSQAVDLAAMARKLYYGIELLWLPGRWTNDVVGLAYVLLPLIALTAWRTRGRVRFYAIAALLVTALMRLNTPEFAYLFLRPMHLLAVFTPVAVAGLMAHVLTSTWRRAAIAVFAAIYVQMWWHPVPHVPGIDAIEPALAADIRQADAAVVLVENTSHRDMDADPSRSTQKPTMSVHFEGQLPRLTGKRLYAGLWDGWMWCPQRDRVLAAGAWHGKSLDRTTSAEIQTELKDWGVSRLYVWSDASRAYFRADPAFEERWHSGDWVGFAMRDPDVRQVAVPAGRAWLTDLSPLGGVVHLDQVPPGGRVVVRTSYFPAWTATAGGAPVALVNHDGQLAFDAPAGADRVDLVYPRRTWLLITVLAAVAASAVLAGVLRYNSPVSSALAAGAPPATHTE